MGEMGAEGESLTAPACFMGEAGQRLLAKQVDDELRVDDYSNYEYDQSNAVNFLSLTHQ
jgi:hypothetical protein